MVKAIADATPAAKGGTDATRTQPLGIPAGVRFFM
jgi:hypothetical protein